MHINSHFDRNNIATMYLGDRLELLKQIPNNSANLIITSPPYNIGKSYESIVTIDDYLQSQKETLQECVRITADTGSICWQLGNHIAKNGEVVPLDLLLYPICKTLGLRLRNRIVWHFEHGLHCKNRFSGRYETILWFTKTDNYVFNLDPIRVPQKYPGKKHFKGKNIGKLSCNPLGKNPGDVWIIPNVKHNHVEKTSHPCQFPIELIERFVLSMTNENDLVVDPYMGVASTLCAAVCHKRRCAGSELIAEYLDIGKQRVEFAYNGTLKIRPMGKPVQSAK
jgi:adenine-specific DNA-methyltransferase